MDKEKYTGEAKMTEEPGQGLRFIIKDNAIKTKHLDDDAVTTDKIKDRNVTPEKLSESVQTSIVMPLVHQVDEKYGNITDELYNMVRSLQVGGVALSNVFGDRTDIGITQKALTEAFYIILEKIAEMTGHSYADFTLTISPTLSYSESTVDIQVTADCTGSIKNFDSIKIYVNDELVRESSDLMVYTTTVPINKTSTIKAVGTIFGKGIEKSAVSVIEVPFFMGSGQYYSGIMDEAHRKVIDGTIEGDYDITVDHTGDYIFIIIPKTRESEWRRADMNGYEIPMTKTVKPNWIVYQSVNTYNAGTYNIDIDINT